jgi:hypothetical protein
MLRRDTRIAVVGGGASGLSAAYLLKKAGYGNVTVFEKEDRLGGKCKTVFFDDLSYELGAVVHLEGMEPVASFIREFGIETVSGTVNPRPRPRRPFMYDPIRLRHFVYPRIPSSVLAFGRFCLMARQRPELGCAGHEDMPPDLAVPLSEWLAANGLESLELLFACWLSGFGYGYTHRIPAAYALKLCTPRTMIAILGGRSSAIRIRSLRGFKKGYQGLWDRIGAVLDVRLSHSIDRITRGDTIQVETEGHELEFDKLILCCDLRGIAEALDVDEEESEMIGKIRNHRYHALIAEVEGLPSGVAFLPAHFSERHAGAAMCWYNRWTENNLFNLYAVAGDEMSAEDVHRKVGETARQVGGKLIRILSSENWNYFPSVSCDDLKAGFYRRLEGRQGRRNTFYAGEIMNFPCVDLSAAYSAHLVQKHFA